MKYLCSLLILLSAAATAQIPYSQEKSLISEFKPRETEKASYTVKPKVSSSVEKSAFDNMPILFPEFKVSMMLEVSPPEKMPNPLFKEED